MNKDNIKKIILRCKNKFDSKMYSRDFAKGYCYGVINSSSKITQDEYDELANMIDDTFDD